MEASVSLINRIVREEEGQDMVEYALLVGLISIVAVASLLLAGGSIKNIWSTVATKLGQAETAANS